MADRFLDDWIAIGCVFDAGDPAWPFSPSLALLPWRLFSLSELVFLDAGPLRRADSLFGAELLNCCCDPECLSSFSFLLLDRNPNPLNNVNTVSR